MVNDFVVGGGRANIVTGVALDQPSTWAISSMDLPSSRLAAENVARGVLADSGVAYAITIST